MQIYSLFLVSGQYYLLALTKRIMLRPVTLLAINKIQVPHESM